jgi:hypothetical protein
MHLVVVDARAEETARAWRLAQTNRTVIEIPADRPTAGTADDLDDRRIWIRCPGQRGGWTQVVDGHGCHAR